MKKLLRRVVLPVGLATLLTTMSLDFAAAQDKKDKGKPKDAKGAVAALFELYTDSAGEFRFRLRDDEGGLLATSGKGYKTKAECQKVIETIRREAARAKLDDQTK
jgi:uncharacterized protein YegP (UPF0339 family)